jgi:hypothetical protein
VAPGLKFMSWMTSPTSPASMRASAVAGDATAAAVAESIARQDPGAEPLQAHPPEPALFADASHVAGVRVRTGSGDVEPPEPALFADASHRD